MKYEHSLHSYSIHLGGGDRKKKEETFETQWTFKTVKPEAILDFLKEAGDCPLRDYGDLSENVGFL